MKPTLPTMPFLPSPDTLLGVHWALAASPYARFADSLPQPGRETSGSLAALASRVAEIDPSAASVLLQRSLPAYVAGEQAVMNAIWQDFGSLVVKLTGRRARDPVAPTPVVEFEGLKLVSETLLDPVLMRSWMRRSLEFIEDKTVLAKAKKILEGSPILLGSRQAVLLTVVRTVKNSGATTFSCELNETEDPKILKVRINIRPGQDREEALPLSAHDLQALVGRAILAKTLPSAYSHKKILRELQEGLIDVTRARLDAPLVLLSPEASDPKLVDLYGAMMNSRLSHTALDLFEGRERTTPDLLYGIASRMAEANPFLGLHLLDPAARFEAAVGGMGQTKALTAFQQAILHARPGTEKAAIDHGAAERIARIIIRPNTLMPWLTEAVRTHLKADVRYTDPQIHENLVESLLASPVALDFSHRGLVLKVSYDKEPKIRAAIEKDDNMRPRVFRIVIPFSHDAKGAPVLGERELVELLYQAVLSGFTERHLQVSELSEEPHEEAIRLQNALARSILASEMSRLKRLIPLAPRRSHRDLLDLTAAVAEKNPAAAVLLHGHALREQKAQNGKHLNSAWAGFLGVVENALAVDSMPPPIAEYGVVAKLSNDLLSHGTFFSVIERAVQNQLPPQGAKAAQILKIVGLQKRSGIFLTLRYKKVPYLEASKPEVVDENYLHVEISVPKPEHGVFAPLPLQEEDLLYLVGRAFIGSYFESVESAKTGEWYRRVHAAALHTRVEPPHDVAGGEGALAAVKKALRNSPFKSLAADLPPQVVAYSSALMELNRSLAERDANAAVLTLGPAVRAEHAGTDEAVTQAWRDFARALETRKKGGFREARPLADYAVLSEVSRILLVRSRFASYVRGSFDLALSHNVPDSFASGLLKDLKGVHLEIEEGAWRGLEVVLEETGDKERPRVVIRVPAGAGARKKSPLFSEDVLRTLVGRAFVGAHVAQLLGDKDARVVRIPADGPFGGVDLANLLAGRRQGPPPRVWLEEAAVLTAAAKERQHGLSPSGNAESRRRLGQSPRFSLWKRLGDLKNSDRIVFDPLSGLRSEWKLDLQSSDEGNRLQVAFKGDLMSLNVPRKLWKQLTPEDVVDMLWRALMVAKDDERRYARLSRRDDEAFFNKGIVSLDTLRSASDLSPASRYGRTVLRQLFRLFQNPPREAGQNDAGFDVQGDGVDGAAQDRFGYAIQALGRVLEISDPTPWQGVLAMPRWHLAAAGLKDTPGSDLVDLIPVGDTALVIFHGTGEGISVADAFFLLCVHAANPGAAVRVDVKGRLVVIGETKPASDLFANIAALEDRELSDLQIGTRPSRPAAWAAFEAFPGFPAEWKPSPADGIEELKRKRDSFYRQCHPDKVAAMGNLGPEEKVRRIEWFKSLLPVWKGVV